MRGNEIVDGNPIRVYDDGGKTIDRYTVVFTRLVDSRFSGQYYPALAMNGAPFHPQGFCQHTDAMLGSHLGKRIEFATLPEDCQKAVRQEWR